MPSSTSSSSATSRASDRAPAGPWGRTWLLALMLALGGLGAWEFHWRQQGFAPTVPDTEWSWQRQRLRASSGDPDTVALLGSSVILAAVDPQRLAAINGGPSPLHLGVTGSSPLPILEDLAADESFVGLALCEYRPRELYDPTHGTEILAKQNLAALRRAQADGPAARIERVLRRAVQGRLVARHAQLSPEKVLTRGLRGVAERPNQLRVRADRTLVLDYSAGPPRVRRGPGISPDDPPRFASDAQVAATLARVERAVQRIRARGGAVAFVDIPCTGPYRDVDARRFPRELYWKPIAERTSAILLDPAALPDPPALQCPDGAHLEHSSQRGFTRALAELLRRNGLGPGAGSARDGH